MSRQRFLNHKVEITSRMSSYDIPKKLSQLETPYTDRNCLDTAIATNMIAVGMDVDRLGLMVIMLSYIVLLKAQQRHRFLHVQEIAYCMRWLFLQFVCIIRNLQAMMEQQLLIS